MSRMNRGRRSAAELILTRLGHFCPATALLRPLSSHTMMACFVKPPREEGGTDGFHA
jgi:hypothetical protein